MWPEQTMPPAISVPYSPRVRKPDLNLSSVFANFYGYHCLVLERDGASGYAGQWVAPTTIVRMCEEPRYAALRALHEKAGIWGKITSGPHIEEKIRSRKNGSRRIIYHYFTADPLDVVGLGSHEKEWFKPGQIRAHEDNNIAECVPRLMEEMGLFQ